MSYEVEQENAERRRQHHNLFHQGEVVGVTDGLLNVAIVTPNGDVTFKGLMLLGRDPEELEEGEPCFVICPQGDPAQGVVVMQMPDPRVSILIQEVESLRSEISGYQEQIQQLSNQVQQLSSQIQQVSNSD